VRIEVDGQVMLVMVYGVERRLRLEPGHRQLHERR
jgi:hypothetical protein